MAAQSRYSSKARSGPTRSNPLRILMVLLLSVVVLGASLAYTATKDSSNEQMSEGERGQWLPKLGLDLQGGTSITLIPQAIGEGVISEVEVNQAATIIRQRIDAFGVAEAEVIPEGSGNNRKIVVSLPGQRDENLVNLVRQSAQLRFRLVLRSAPGTAGSDGAANQQPFLPEDALPGDQLPGIDQPEGGPPPAESQENGGRQGDPEGQGAAEQGNGQEANTTDPNTPDTKTTGPNDTAAGQFNSQPVFSSTPGDLPRGVAPAADLAAHAVITPASFDGASQVHTAALAPASAALPAVSPPPDSPAPPSPPEPARRPTPTGADATPEQPQGGRTPGEPVASVEQHFIDLDCMDPAALVRQVDDPTQQLASCGVDQDGQPDGFKYLLDRAVLVGSDIQSAQAEIASNQQGQPTGGFVVSMTFKSEAARTWAKHTTETVGQQTAIVLDGQVVSAPITQEAIPGGQMSISNSSDPFTREYATNLANFLRYGALPLSFQTDQIQEISPTLGSKQLQAGLLAGLIGVILIIAYSALYYRALGLVNVGSLLISLTLTYLIVTLMSNTIGLRLSLAGVAGLVIGIGISADSFVVYFERLRDELRGGKTLRVAAEVAWVRARRTIVASDFVSFLAAVVLYFLAIGSVRGFAVMLGLSTIVDVIVVFLFTKPMVSLLARTKYFSQRRKMSGLADTGQPRDGEHADTAPRRGGRPVRQGA